VIRFYVYLLCVTLISLTESELMSEVYSTDKAMVAPVDLNQMFATGDKHLRVFVLDDSSDANSSSSQVEESLTSEKPTSLNQSRKRKYQEDTSEISHQERRRRYEEDPSVNPVVEKSRRNALTAKQNRDKKKKYIQELETSLTELSSKNKVLTQENVKIKSVMSTLQDEVAYLKSVLHNQSQLASMLSNMKDLETVKLSSTFSLSSETSPASSAVSGGICLHTNGRNVSLEMCVECSKRANS